MNKHLNLFFVLMFVTQTSIANNIDCIRALSSIDPDLKSTNLKEGTTIDLPSGWIDLWHEASKASDVRGLMYLIQLLEKRSHEKGFNDLDTVLNMKYDDGNTMLHMVAQMEDLDTSISLLIFLLDNGANISQLNDLEETPYEVAKEYNNTVAMTLMKAHVLPAGESLQKQNMLENQGILDSVFDIKTNAGVDRVFKIYAERRARLIENVKNRMIEAIQKESMAEITILFDYIKKHDLENMHNLSIKNDGGVYNTTPLIIAARLGNTDMVEFFMKVSSNSIITKQDSLGKNVLHVAVEQDVNKVKRTILTVQTILNSIDHSKPKMLLSLMGTKDTTGGNTPLHTASNYDSAELLGFMLEQAHLALTQSDYKLLLEIKNKRSRTISDILRQQSKDAIAGVLDEPSKVHALAIALAIAHRKEVRLREHNRMRIQRLVDSFGIDKLTKALNSILKRDGRKVQYGLVYNLRSIGEAEQAYIYHKLRSAKGIISFVVTSGLIAGPIYAFMEHPDLVHPTLIGVSITLIALIYSGYLGVRMNKNLQISYEKVKVSRYIDELEQIMIGDTKH